MKLSEWLTTNQTSLETLAQKLEVSPVAVSRYIAGKRIPHKEVMTRLKEATNNQVTADDFY